MNALPDATISDYGAIGDCRTLALVSRFGSIDWYCLPDFSGPSLFAALLDRERGGCFALVPRQVQAVEQRYEERTNVLRTRFSCAGGEVELTDFMTALPAGGGVHHAHPPREIVRILRCTQGTCEVDALFQPRPGYALGRPQLVPQGEGRWLCPLPESAAQLSTTIPFRPQGDDTLCARVTLASGERHVALLQTPPPPAAHPASLAADAEAKLAATLGWWRDWSSRCTYQGEYAEAVMRSALALKLLTHAPSGAVVAAGTTSLPEGESGARNWDYRFCWLRDTSLVLQAFIDLGYLAESDAFLRWLLHATRSTRPKLQVVYDVSGDALLDERVLPQLRGYHGIGPVRIGNAASRQVQHDVYGEVLLTACEDCERGGTLNHKEVQLLAGFVNVVCDLWREPDHGIWEIRLPPRHNTHSKLMCWAALDRALRLHEGRGLPIDVRRVTSERDAIRADIEAHAWVPSLNSYVGFYGSRCADSSLLLMPRLGYLPARDPRMLGTVRRILEDLSVNGLLYRYPPNTGYDGVPGTEHLFAICSFWCVDCLARQGRLDEAQAMYERLLRLRNHAGLYAEEFGVHDGRPMGNFPQAFSHVGLITAALSIAAARRAAAQARRIGTEAAGPP
jgi:GH15 family glucan-1,4-alpha-glucosidase